MSMFMDSATGEPGFLLTASDPLTPQLVKMWADVHYNKRTTNLQQLREYQQTLQSVQRMREWYDEQNKSA